jgi:hypothetical protein
MVAHDVRNHLPRPGAAAVIQVAVTSASDRVRDRRGRRHVPQAHDRIGEPDTRPVYVSASVRHAGTVSIHVRATAGHEAPYCAARWFVIMMKGRHLCKP